MEQHRERYVSFFPSKIKNRIVSISQSHVRVPSSDVKLQPIPNSVAKVAISIVDDYD